MEEGEHRTSFFIIMHRGKERKEERGRRPGKSAIRGISFFASLGERVIDHGLNNLYPSQRMKTASSSSSDGGEGRRKLFMFLIHFSLEEKDKGGRGGGGENHHIV